MNNREQITHILAIGGLVLSLVVSATSVTAEEIDFNQDVLPILADKCFACHGFDEAAREAGLRLDTRDGLVESGAVDLGDPANSELMARIETDDEDIRMPPPKTGKSISIAERKILSQWIQQGATYSKHWAFRPISNDAPPTVKGTRHPIDRFIIHKLRLASLSPSQPAELATQLRRASLDVIGLPPELSEIESFRSLSAQSTERAWENTVDRLLANPMYGQKWSRWWLDQARYADSNGYSIDAPRSIWLYRDWVIDALNSDMPFDQFTIEQLAGDLLPNATVQQKIATGFHRNTQINQEGGIDREQYRIDSIFDRVGTTGTVWLGLTVGCAQCHDHKFDPISQKEFYQLFAFLNNQDEPSLRVYGDEIDVDGMNKQKKQIEDTINKLVEGAKDEIEKWESDLNEESKKKLSKNARKAIGVVAKKRNFDQRVEVFLSSKLGGSSEVERLYKERAAISRKLGSAPTTMVLSERSSPRKTTIYVKGDFTRPAEEVSPGTLSTLHSFECESNKPNRLDLANWIVDADNPITARVIVNRIWQQYFGVGLVATENDFGLVGARPTHPELLDWLANFLIEHDWSLKEIHRVILTSKTYRQSSVKRDDLMSVDADNRLLAKQNRIRLDAELVRDVALHASGLLSNKFGGPPVYPPIPDGVMNQGQVNRRWNASTGENRNRRGVYAFIYRATPIPSLNVFDAPDGFSSCTRRTRSNTPLQSLTLMNDRGFFEFAQALSETIKNKGVEIAFERCTSRKPTNRELEILRSLDSLNAARALLCLDETITRE